MLVFTTCLVNVLHTHTQPPMPGGGAVVPSAGTAVATRENSGPVTGIANVGIRRAEIKQGTYLSRFIHCVLIVNTIFC